MVCRQKFDERPDVKVAEIVAQQALEGLCLGKSVEGMTCNCGAIHLDSGIVTAILSPGDKYGVYQVGEWYLWALEITPPCGRKWSCDLSFVADTEKVKSIFDNCFGNLGLFD